MGEEESSSKPLVTRRIVGRRLEGVTVFDDDPMDGGSSIRVWMELWTRSHEAGVGGPRFVAWPDGRSLLDQPAIVVRVFGLIGAAMDDFRARREAQNGAGK